MPNQNNNAEEAEYAAPGLKKAVLVTLVPTINKNEITQGNATTIPTVQPMRCDGLRARSPNHIPIQHKAMISRTRTIGASAR